jgi:hypothetical protein
VTWGDQTWEEMAVSFLTVSEPLKAVLEENVKAETDFYAKHVRREIEATAYAEEKADEMMSRLDRNGDGAIWRSEAPNSFRHFVFDWYDTNNDGSVMRDECVEFLKNYWEDR